MHRGRRDRRPTARRRAGYAAGPPALLPCWQPLASPWGCRRRWSGTPPKPNAQAPAHAAPLARARSAVPAHAQHCHQHWTIQHRCSAQRAMPGESILRCHWRRHGARAGNNRCVGRIGRQGAYGLRRSGEGGVPGRGNQRAHAEAVRHDLRRRAGSWPWRFYSFMERQPSVRAATQRHRGRPVGLA